MSLSIDDKVVENDETFEEEWPAQQDHTQPRCCRGFNHGLMTVRKDKLLQTARLNVILSLRG